MVWSTSVRYTWPSLRAAAEQEHSQVGPAHLFQAELELSCMACRAAWNRGRSLRTGELMKRGRGLLKEPILWDCSVKDRAMVSPPFIGSGGAEQDHQKGSSLKGSRVNLSNVHESSCPRTQSKAKSQPWTSSSPSCRVVTWAAWRMNWSSPAMQRERKSQAEKGGMKISCAITINRSFGKTLEFQTSSTALFLILPLKQRPNRASQKSKHALSFDF